MQLQHVLKHACNERCSARNRAEVSAPVLQHPVVVAHRLTSLSANPRSSTRLLGWATSALATLQRTASLEHGSAAGAAALLPTTSLDCWCCVASIIL